MCGANTHDFLPEGETHPEARKLVTRILRDVLLFAICDLPEGTPIILEAPLIGHRGEAVVDELSTGGFPMQVLIVHSPAMQSRVLQQGEQQTRKTSAQELAIRQIHKGLLQQRGITSLSQQMQDSELAESWEQWLGYREGLVLTWNPADDEAGFLYTREALKAKKVSPDPLTPQEVSECTALRIELTLQTLPNVEAFATEVRRYRR